MKKAAVINFKGGVGKTTVSLHLAAYLAREHRVLLIDVDHQSSLSIVLLGAKLWQKCVKEHRTINRVFESFCNRKIPMPQQELIVRNPIFERHNQGRWYKDFYPLLDFVSAQFELDDTEIDLASTNYGNPMLSEWEKRTLLATWLDSIDASEEYDYVIFDCPPATKIVSQNTLAASDSYVIPVIPDDLSSRGVTHFRGLVQQKIDAKLAYLRETARVSDDETPTNYVAATKLAGILPFLETLITDEATPRKVLERIAIHRFEVPAGSMRSFSNKQMLVNKLITLIRNEQAHATIETVARGQRKE